MQAIRADFLNLYHAALESVEGGKVVIDALPDILQQHVPDKDLGDLQIVAIGKAAEAMLEGALHCLHSLNKTPANALLISKTAHISAEFYNNPLITCIESAHPVPDESSLFAGKSLIKFLQTSQAPCVFLISGGTSSLVEVLQQDWTLDELQEITQWMLANAYSIEEINAVRSHISEIKQGGLWRYLQNRKVICLLISDVPSDDAAVIGSGLLFPKTTPIDSTHIPESLPLKWQQKLSSSVKPSAPSSFYSYIIASNKQARQAVAQAAREKGYSTKIIAKIQQDSAEEVAQHCVQMARENPNTIIIWGAETTVLLPENPGKGGRNQHLALAAAIELEDDNQSCLLAAGTDGTDGETDDAGALVDGQTLHRARVDGFIARKSLQQADSGHFLYASGDLISTGVTGTNVMDLIIAVNLIR